MQQGRRAARATVLVLGALLALSGCTLQAVTAPTATSRPVPATSSPAGTPSPSPVPTFPAAPKSAPAADAASRLRAFGTGCAASSSRMPATRFTATIGDVDGDGRADTEWATIADGGGIEFGVTTASGVTIAKTVGFASGGGRAVSIGTLATGQTVALPTDGHASLIYELHDCRWVEPRSAHQTAGTDFLTGYYDPPEDGGGCVGRRLYQVDETQPSTDHRTITGIEEHLSADGRRMTAGRRVTFLSDVGPDSTPDPGQQYGGGLCQGSELLRPEHRG